MCGIAGYIGKRSIEQPQIRETLELMKNRGPDYRGSVTVNNGNVNIALLHSRLSIIDLEQRSNQPFTIGDCTLIFNGEIYNYVELRQDLEKQGIKLRTNSDTEVLLQYYILFGEECVNYFEGMWSFAIYDRGKQRIFLSRDRFAEKPLYFLKTDYGVFFGSEIKFIKSLAAVSLTVNLRHLSRYMVNGYKALYKSPDTFFQEIQEVPYATNAVIDPQLRLRFQRYWTAAYTPQPMSLNEAIEGFRHRLLESVRLRLRADVPMAFCLSGGVDSAAIVSIAAKSFHYDVATFSIVDKDVRYNEYDNIRATIDALGCKHTIIDISQENVFTRLKDLVEYHDAPVYTISYYIHSFLSEAIAKGGYRVVASGTAADELASGYYDHFNLHLYEMRQHPRYQKYLQDWEKNVKGFVRNPYLQNPRLYFDQPGFRDHIYLNNDTFTGFMKTDFRETFTENSYSDSLLRNRMLNELFHESIPVILHEDDLNSMFYSIENRSPYLDSKLFAFAYSIPNEYLIHDGYAKYILRESVKGILNEKVRTDRQKKGFNASINSLFDFDKEDSRACFLDDGKIFEFVKRDKIEQLLKRRPLPNSFSKFLFSFLNARIFLELNG